jgi:dipeptidyl aminopeptidase/acylaminoacyl peptidase
MVWVDREGREQPLALPPGDYHYPRVSPDGASIALRVGTPPNSDIYIYSIPRNNLSQFTFDQAGNHRALWSPDGQHIVFSKTLNGQRDLFLRASDGTGVATQLTMDAGTEYVSAWSADSQQVFFHECGSDNTVCDIGMLDLSGEAEVKMLLQSESNEFAAVLSPDGRWLAYTLESDVFVRPFPNLDSGRWQVSTTNGGLHPIWSADGRELIYWSDEGMMSVTFETEPQVVLGTPRVLFDVGAYSTERGRSYGATPERDRFLLLKPQGDPRIMVVLNWFDELERLIPTK